MLNELSLNAVNGSQFSLCFRKPLYQSYCFANLPATLSHLLSGLGQSTLPLDVLGKLPTRYNKVALFFVDGFGWRFFERYADKYPLIKRLLEQGAVSKLTSQFPSATAAHVTCIHTGLNVGQNGVYEWNYYEPLVDAVITPLRFAYAGDKQQDSLKGAGLAPEAFYPTHTFYQTLQSQGVQSHVFQPSFAIYSTYSNVVLKGATSLNPFRTLEDGLIRLTSRILTKEESPAYYLFYYDKIDATSHLNGPDSSELLQALDVFFTALEHLFYQKLHHLTGDTLVILTADHGHTKVSPRTTFYLNQEIPGIERYLKKNQVGRPLVPAGSARDMFLHVKEESLDEALVLLQKHLQGRAEIYRTHELISQNFFGSTTPSSAFLAHVGNVVILPYPGETVWWFEQGRSAMRFQGHHGGLTAEEMEIPLLLLPL